MINIGDISKPSVSRSQVKSKSKTSGSKVGQAEPIEQTRKANPEKQEQENNPQYEPQSGSATKNNSKIEQEEDLTYDKKGHTKPNTNLDFKA